MRQLPVSDGHSIGTPIGGLRKMRLNSCSIDRKNVLLQGGRAVPISRSKQEETRTRYLLYRGARL